MQQFIPSQTFTGIKNGYIFTTRKNKTGYYLESNVIDESVSSTFESKKRKRSLVAKPTVDLDQLEKENPLISFEEVSESIRKAVDENIKARSEHPNEPMKFLGSEIALDESIAKLKIYASDVETYQKIPKSTLLSTLVELLAHANDDIVKDVLEIFVEYLDKENLSDFPDEITSAFVHASIASGLPEILISLLNKFNENTEVISRCIFYVLEILENLLELDDTFSKLISTKYSNFLVFLTSRINAGKHDTNRQYAAEMLFAIVSKLSASDNLVMDETLFESLLTCASRFRKTLPSSTDEEETIANIFNTITTLLVLQENRDSFRKLEGQALMIRIIQCRAYAYSFATKALAQSLETDPKSCELYISLGGLKTLFPLFMERGLKIRTIAKAHSKPRKPSKSRTREIARSVFESSITCILHLLQNNTVNSIPYRRVLRKFAEGTMDKCDRLVELFVEYRQSLDFNATDMTEEEIYVTRIDLGWEYFGYICIILAHLFNSDDIHLTRHLETLLYQNKLGRGDVKKSLEIVCQDLQNVGAIPLI